MSDAAESTGGAESGAAGAPPTAAVPKSKLVPVVLALNTVIGAGAVGMVARRGTSAAATRAVAGQAAPAGHEAPAAGHEAPAAAGHEAPAAAGHEAPAGEKGAEEHGSEGKGAKVQEAGLGAGPMLKLEGFVVQLRTVDADRYARVAFDLELAHESDRPALEKRISHIRDAVIMYLSDRTLDEIRGSEGMQRLKDNLLKRFDALIPGRRLRAIYITDLVVQ